MGSAKGHFSINQNDDYGSLDMSYAGSETSSNFYDVRKFIPDEINHGDKGYARGPERALMNAILFDGIQAYLSYVMLGASKKEKGRSTEAYNWVHTESEEYIFSFDSVCEALGMDANFLRLGLANVANSRKSWKQARRNF